MRSPFDPGPGDAANSVEEIYAQQTPPLLPSAADLLAHQAALALGDESLDVLMLGVTPGIYHLPWPRGSTIHAVDRSLPMIDHVWPGPTGTATVGDWARLPFGAAEFDRVVCDGGLAFFGPASLGTAQSEVARVLRPGGRFVARVYAWDRTETLDRVMSDVERRAVSTAAELRLRSWSALQQSLELGVVVGAAFDAVVDRVGSVEHLVEHSGLEASQFVPLLASKHSTLRYTIWPLDRLIDAWTAPGDFELVGTSNPSHHLGALCPVVSFRRLPTG